MTSQARLVDRARFVEHRAEGMRDAVDIFDVRAVLATRCDAIGWKKRQRVARISSRSTEISTSYSLTSVCGSTPRMSVWT